jgi:hypothetical protein
MGSKKKNKEEKNGPPLFSEGDEGGGGLTGMRASEAKGPFPGGKRVGSWGKRESKKEKAKGVGRAPADLQPPLNKKWWAYGH